MTSTVEHGPQSQQRTEPDPRLQVLLAEYAALREDERSSSTVIAAMFGVALTLLGGLAALSFNACTGPRDTDCIDRWIFALLPMAAVVVLAFIGIVGAVATVRGFFLRAIEREIYRRSGTAIQFSASSDRSQTSIPAASYHHALMGLLSPRSGLLEYRLLSAAMLVPLGVIFAGITMRSMWISRPHSLQIAMGAVYLVAAVILARVLWSSTFGGRTLIRSVLGQVPLRFNESLTHRPASQLDAPLLPYLLLPRPGDVIKAAFLGLAIPVTALSTGADLGARWWEVAAAVLIFELLVYQARYTWNDIRDLDGDAEHPFWVERRRLPRKKGQRRTTRLVVTVALASIGARLGLAWYLAGTLTDLLGIVLRWSVFLVFGIGILYEAMRNAGKREITFESTALGGVAERLAHAKHVDQAVYASVGLGYALRTCLGIWIGSAGDPSPWALAVGAVAMGTFGIAFVTMTWTLEASSFFFAGQTKFSRALLERSRLGPLAAQAGMLHPADAITDEIALRRDPKGRIQEDASRAGEQVLRERSGLSIWNVATLGAMAAGAALGGILSSAGFGRVAVLVALATIGSMSLIKVATSLIAGLAVVVATGAALVWVPVAAITVTIVAGTYLVMRFSNYRAIIQAPGQLDPLQIMRGLVAVSRRVSLQVARFVVGPEAVSTIISRPASQDMPVHADDIGTEND